MTRAPATAPKRASRITLSSAFLSRMTTHPVEYVLGLSLAGLPAFQKDIAAAEERVRELRDSVSQRLYTEIPAIADKAARSRALDLKRLVRHAQEPFPPETLPTDLSAETLGLLAELTAGLARRSELLESWRSAFRQGLDDGRKRLRAILKDPFVQEGVFLSSEELYKAVRRYLDRPSPGSDEKLQDVELSAIEHLTRSCVKTTPRGLLTATGMGRCVGAAPEGARLSWRDGLPIGKRHTLVSWVFLRDICKRLSGLDGLRERVVPRPNPTWHMSGEQICFWRREGADETLNGIPAHPFVLDVLRLCARREYSARALLARLGRKHGISTREARTHYRRLCEQGLVIGHLEIPHGELDGLDYLIGWLRKAGAPGKAAGFLKKLLSVRDSLRRLDDPSWSWGPEKEAAYREARKTLDELAPGRTEAASRLFVVDSAPAVDSAVAGGPVLVAVERAVDAICRSSAPFGVDRFAANMQKRLAERFPDRALIPLMELYGSGHPRDFIAMEPKPATYFEQYLEAAEAPSASALEAGGGLDRFIEAKDGPRREITGVFFFHVIISPDGRTGIVSESFWNSPTPISRWSHLFSTPTADPIAEKMIKCCMPSNARGKRLKASFIYSEESRLDTAGWHPNQLPYNVELGTARSSLASDRVIPLNELSIRLSERGPRLVWRRGGGRKADVEVEPWLWSNFGVVETNPWMILFAVLSYIYGTRSPDVGPWLSTGFHRVRAHSPRVTDGNVVLRRETWRVERKDLLPLAAIRLEEAVLGFDRWRAARKMPRFVFLTRQYAGATGAQCYEVPWMIDFHNPFHAAVLQNHLRRYTDLDTLIVEEALPAPDQAWSGNASGHFAHELAVTFKWRP